MCDEGVIKYRLDYQVDEPLQNHDYAALDYWHQRFKAEQILGQDPARYGGLGFGNLSQRIDEHSFLISGTQTGELERLQPEHYALVTAVDLAANQVEARGPVKPSSESLTHAAVYSIDASIQFVFHVHSPEIWNARDRLGIAQTGKDIAYGTPEMASEMIRLYQQGGFQKGNILAMSGHEDGIISFADNADEAGNIIIETLRIA
jgi:ribulose-5-phosphate 4-epimerase/fuculose-1-phosphate aldolase